MHFYSEKHIHELEKYLWVKSAPWSHEIRLLEKVSQYNSYFRYVPGILGIAVCNSLAMNSAHETSDIDLFIITKQNRLWTARICMTLLLTLTRQRKTSKHHAWKFCLSFFITEDNLSLETIAIENDIYLSYWINTLRPIVNRQNIFWEFLKVNKTLTEFFPKVKNETTKICSPSLQMGERIQEWGHVGNILEKILKVIFLSRTKKSFHKLWKPFWVVISDTMLKFHDKDKRIEIRDKIISS